MGAAVGPGKAAMKVKEYALKGIEEKRRLYALAGIG